MYCSLLQLCPPAAASMHTMPVFLYLMLDAIMALFSRDAA